MWPHPSGVARANPFRRSFVADIDTSERRKRSLS